MGPIQNQSIPVGNRFQAVTKPLPLMVSIEILPPWYWFLFWKWNIINVLHCSSGYLSCKISISYLSQANSNTYRIYAVWLFSSLATKLAFMTDFVWYGGICQRVWGPSVSPPGNSRCKSPPDEYISKTWIGSEWGLCKRISGL